ncbi:MAG: DUF2339 domain-containing protein, partial [Chloroflexota bacterium]|nr:DUF2339 domain-containing protein [Chloroflexota bacterium]
GTLAFMLGALGVAVYWLRSRNVRTTLATVGFVLTLYALPFEVSGVWLLTCWSLVWLLAAALDRTSRIIPTFRWMEARLGLDLRLVSWLAGLLLGAYFVLVVTPLDRLHHSLPTVPFVDTYSRAAGVLILACLAGAALASQTSTRRTRVIAAFVVAAWLMPLELGGASLVVAWCGLAAALCLLANRDRGGVQAYATTVAVIATLALLVTFETVAPIERLAVDPYHNVLHAPFWSGATAALLALSSLLALRFHLSGGDRRGRWLVAGAGLLLVYALSVGVVDEFQRRVGSESLDELQKAAQVALSILWATTGGAAFVLGVARSLGLLRAGGLSLLALATTKVFLYDLASLDATYRVPSFIGLGVLLLTSSYAYQRMSHRTEQRRPQ